MSAVSLADVANLSLQMQGSVLSYLCAMITIEKGLENPMNKKIWKKAFIRSIPILFSYLFVGAAYGMMMQQAGFPGIFHCLQCSHLYRGFSVCVNNLFKQQCFYVDHRSDCFLYGGKKWTIVKRYFVHSQCGVFLCADEPVCKTGWRSAGVAEKFFQKSGGLCHRPCGSYEGSCKDPGGKRKPFIFIWTMLGRNPGDSSVIFMLLAS